MPSIYIDINSSNRDLILYPNASEFGFDICGNTVNYPSLPLKSWVGRSFDTSTSSGSVDIVVVSVGENTIIGQGPLNQTRDYYKNANILANGIFSKIISYDYAGEGIFFLKNQVSGISAGDTIKILDPTTIIYTFVPGGLSPSINKIIYNNTKFEHETITFSNSETSLISFSSPSTWDASDVYTIRNFLPYESKILTSTSNEIVDAVGPDNSIIRILSNPDEYRRLIAIDDTTSRVYPPLSAPPTGLLSEIIVSEKIPTNYYGKKDNYLSKYKLKLVHLIVPNIKEITFWPTLHVCIRMDEGSVSKIITNFTNSKNLMFVVNTNSCDANEKWLTLKSDIENIVQWRLDGTMHISIYTPDGNLVDFNTRNSQFYDDNKISMLLQLKQEC